MLINEFFQENFKIVVSVICATYRTCWWSV